MCLWKKTMAKLYKSHLNKVLNVVLKMFFFFLNTDNIVFISTNCLPEVNHKSNIGSTNSKFSLAYFSRIYIQSLIFYIAVFMQ